MGHPPSLGGLPDRPTPPTSLNGDPTLMHEAPDTRLFLVQCEVGLWTVTLRNNCFSAPVVSVPAIVPAVTVKTQTSSGRRPMQRNTLGAAGYWQASVPMKSRSPATILYASAVNWPATLGSALIS